MKLKREVDFFEVEEILASNGKRFRAETADLSVRSLEGRSAALQPLLREVSTEQSHCLMSEGVISWDSRNHRRSWFARLYGDMTSEFYKCKYCVVTGTPNLLFSYSLLFVLCLLNVEKGDLTLITLPLSMGGGRGDMTPLRRTETQVWIWTCQRLPSPPAGPSAHPTPHHLSHALFPVPLSSCPGLQQSPLKSPPSRPAYSGPGHQRTAPSPQLWTPGTHVQPSKPAPTASHPLSRASPS